MDPDSSLTNLFRNALADASRASNLPTIEENTQVSSSLFIFAFLQCILKHSVGSYRAY